MQFGAINDSDSETTELHSKDRDETLKIVNRWRSGSGGGIGISSEATQVALRGAAGDLELGPPPDLVGDSVGVLGTGSVGIYGMGESVGAEGYCRTDHENPETPGPSGVLGRAAGSLSVAVKGVASGKGGFGVAGSAYGDPDQANPAIGVAGVAMNEKALAGWFRGPVRIDGELQ